MIRVIVELENDEKEARDYPVEDLTFKLRKRHDKVAMDDELRALEALEKGENSSKLND